MGDVEMEERPCGETGFQINSNGRGSIHNLQGDRRGFPGPMLLILNPAAIDRLKAE